MHSKQRFKICICSVTGELESFRIYKGFRIIFPKILLAILGIRKVRIFLIPLSMTVLNPKILGFLFSTGKIADCTSEMWKTKLQKIVGNLLDKRRKLYINGKVI